MNSVTLTNTKMITSWQTLAPIFHITNNADYDRAVEELDQLLDIVGDDETHLLYGLLDTLGTLVSVYEEAHFAEPQATGIDALKFLMEEHQLTQSDLPEIGSQGVVSELLNGNGNSTSGTSSHWPNGSTSPLLHFCNLPTNPVRFRPSPTTSLLFIHTHCNIRFIMTNCV